MGKWLWLHGFCRFSQKEYYFLILQKLFNHFEKCESEMCRIGLLKTLSNAALDLSVHRLEKIARDKEDKYSQLVQVEAILAYKNLINQMPRKVGGRG